MNAIHKSPLVTLMCLTACAMYYFLDTAYRAWALSAATAGGAGIMDPQVGIAVLGFIVGTAGLGIVLHHMDTPQNQPDTHVDQPVYVAAR